MMPPLLAFYRLVYIFWAGMMPAFFYAFINVRLITPAVWRNNHLYPLCFLSNHNILICIYNFIEYFYLEIIILNYFK
ncbi:hypothetical protein C9101_22915 [Escherichia coli]|nr:hypothetical protein C9101_22915 [Escherichia coli]